MKSTDTAPASTVDVPAGQTTNGVAMDRLRAKFEKKHPPPDGIEFWDNSRPVYVRDGGWARWYGLDASAVLCRDYNAKWREFQTAQ